MVARSQHCWNLDALEALGTGILWIFEQAGGVRVVLRAVGIVARRLGAGIGATVEPGGPSVARLGEFWRKLKDGDARLGTLDYETATSHNVNVTVTDAGRHDALFGP